MGESNGKAKRPGEPRTFLATEIKTGDKVWDSAAAIGACLQHLDDIGAEVSTKQPLEDLLDILCEALVGDLVPLRPNLNPLYKPDPSDYRRLFRGKLVDSIADVLAELERDCEEVPTRALPA